MDKRRGNNQSKEQRRASIRRRRKLKPTKAQRTRLEAAKTVLRRVYAEVFDASIADARFEGLIYVGERKYTADEVIDMAAEILAREEARNKELRKQHGL